MDRHSNTKERPIATSQSTVSEGPDLLALVEQSLDDDKAEDIAVIELKGKTAIADYMVVASGTSQRHVGALAEHLREKLKAVGVKGVALEGAEQCDWVLVDAGDVVVHLFRPEVRDFYQLEKMWSSPTPASGVQA